jgi:Ca2+-transporting ATPase
MTMVFTGFVVVEVVKLYVVRWTRNTPLGTNPWLGGAVALSLGLHLAILYTPLRQYFGTVPLAIADWAVIVGAALVALPLLMVVGWIVRTRSERLASRRKALPGGPE